MILSNPNVHKYLMKKFFIVLALCMWLTAHANTNSIGVYDARSGQWYLSKDINTVRPIASITKLMTAMVALDFDYNLERRLVLSRRVPGSLPPGAYSRLDLIRALLVRSDNAAAETLAEDFPGGRGAFIAAMNRAAAQYEMANTRFIDPSGLGVFNVSTVTDLSRMLEAANGYWLIREISTKKQIAIDTAHGKKIRTLLLNNTNSSLLLTFDTITVSKTGYTTPAGFCVAMVVEQNRQQYHIIVLGSKNRIDRYNTVKNAVSDNVHMFSDRHIQFADVAQ